MFLSARNKPPRNPHQDRSPVLRFRAAQNVLITLLSFAFSVSATRLFLEIFSYPKLGGGNFHFAHVLWGGLFLFAATLIPIILINDWAAPLSALLSGLGVGLFIDEVGKFITINNDYFYPSAAPIVYVFFLLTVLLFSQIRLRRDLTLRDKFYGVFERFSEVLDRDLSAYEREELIKELVEIRKGQDQELAKLADAFIEFLKMQKPHFHLHQPGLIDRIRLRLLKIEQKKLPRSRLRGVIILCLVGCGVWLLIQPTLYLQISGDEIRYQELIDTMVAQNLISNPNSGLTWFETKVIMEGGLGMFMIISALLIFFKVENLGFWLGSTILIIALSLVNLLFFILTSFLPSSWLHLNLCF
jgi:hypothetical protein